MDIFAELKNKKRAPVDDVEPAAVKKPRQQTVDSAAASQKIEELGLHKALYYCNIAKTEGILRRKLSIIHSHVLDESKQNGEMKLLLPEVLFDDLVRSALDLQGFEIDPKRVEKDCFCDEEVCEGTKTGCLPSGYYISWKNATQ